MKKFLHAFLLAAIVLATFTASPAFAQVNPNPSTTQIGPPGSGSPGIATIPLYCYAPAGATGAGVTCLGGLKLAIYTVSCAFSVATTCTAAAAVSMGATFAIAPWCALGQVSGATTITGATHSFNAALTTDTPTLTAAASNSNTLVASFVCIGY